MFSFIPLVAPPKISKNYAYYLSVLSLSLKLLSDNVNWNSCIELSLECIHLNKDTFRIYAFIGLLYCTLRKVTDCSSTASTQVARARELICKQISDKKGTVEPLLTDTSLIRTVQLVPGKCPYILCKNNLYNTDNGHEISAPERKFMQT